MVLAVLVAIAGPPQAPAKAMDPGLESADAPDQYRAWALAEKRTGASVELACRPFAEGMVLCFTSLVAGRRVYRTRADGDDLAGVEAGARGEATAALACLESVPVEGFTASYFLCARGDGRDHLPALFPEELAARIGGDVVIGVPARGMLVAWAPGNLDFDKAVAVGIHRMYESFPNPVSPRVYRWNGTGWVVWGQAREIVPGAPP